MPTELTDEVKEFRRNSMTEYFRKITAYAKSIGLENTVCLMPHDMEFVDGILSLDTLCGAGTDPYWRGSHPNGYYDWVYDFSKQFIDRCDSFGKDPHIWVQGYNISRGCEDEIFMATEAAYDAGARTILDWSFRGGEACDYRMENTDLGWHVMGKAMRRIKDRYLDEWLAKERK